MYYNGVLNNSMLNGAIETMKMHPTPENHMIVLEELLKAEFICPVILSKAPLINEKGEPYFAPDCDIQYQMVQNAAGTPFLLAFTNQEQLDKWKSRRTVSEGCYEVVMEFPAYLNLMIRPLPDGKFGPAEGIVIDPFGSNLVIDRDMAANLILRRMQAADREEQERERKAQQAVATIQGKTEGQTGEGQTGEGQQE